MTPNQADRLIAEGNPVKVRSKHFNETFTAVFSNRNRRHIWTKDGWVFDRDDLEVVR